MSGCETPGSVEAAAGSVPNAVRLEPTQDPLQKNGSTAGTEAVTTQYRKMSVTDGTPAGQAALSDGAALPELIPESQTDVAHLSTNPETSVQLGARPHACWPVLALQHPYSELVRR